ncbi:hypothetical protein M3G91_00890 [Micromonospora chalcea]|uniref:hypothetical protein n=1 Tax=Micromonospora chalcea TaxID=1874 RepID=UPI0021A3E5B6|nr:hypothetical protein [Micromonospora chalcea]MCT2276164.1 hypothetical protein [Micromonospora chalcea]
MEMMRTGVNVDPAREPEPNVDSPSAGEQADRAGQPEKYVVDDALWVVPSSNYIDPEPPLETSLFDDRGRLDDAWRLAIDSLQAEADEPEERRKEMEKKAQKLIDEAERSAQELVHRRLKHLTSDTEAAPPGIAGHPVWAGVGRMAKVTRRLVLRHG